VDLAAGSPVVGGHDIWLTGYTADYVALVTWGELSQATWEFILPTVDEAWALVSNQAIKHSTGPTGLLISKLEADLDRLAPTAKSDCRQDIAVDRVPPQVRRSGAAGTRRRAPSSLE
jgi:hypothetical protein